MNEVNNHDATADSSRQQYNHLIAAEIGEEENYNQIDGIINNTKKPSILEHLRQFKPQPSECGDKPEKFAAMEK